MLRVRPAPRAARSASRRAIGLTSLGLLTSLAAWSCADSALDRAGDGEAEPSATAASHGARGLGGLTTPQATWLARAARVPVVARGDAFSTDAPAVGGVLAEVPASPRGETRVLDRLTGVGVRYALRGVDPDAAPARVERDLVVHDDVRPGATRLHRVTPQAVEELVLLTKPLRDPELRWSLALEGATSVRVAHGRVELLDERGAPRLRVARPFVVDAAGVRHEAELDVEGCAVDRDPSPPWRRPVVPVGDDACELVVRWEEGLAHPLLVDPEWQSAGSMNTPRSHHTATVMTSPQQEILLAGGFDENGDAIAEAEVLCPAETCGVTTVTSVGSLGTARGGHTATLVAPGQVLVVGGRTTRNGAGLTSAERYDNSTLAFTASGTLTLGRADHTATLLAGMPARVLVAGGDGQSPGTAQIWQNGAFGGAINMTTRRAGHSAELLSGTGRVLLAGGIGSLGTAVQTAEIFDPTGSTFTATDSMTSPRAFATATRLDDERVLVAGGTNNAGTFYKTADIYDPNLNGGEFEQQVVLMQAERAFHAATPLLGSTGRVLLSGGYNPTDGMLQSSEVFDLDLEQFVLPGLMNEPRAFHTASLLGTGRAIVTGGGFDPGVSALDLGSAISVEILQRDDGEICEIDEECASGFCVGPATGTRVCCDTACTGTCESCFFDKNDSADGTCLPVDGDVIEALCQNAVQLVLACEVGVVTTPEIIPCAPYECAGTECAAACGDDSDCTTNAYCKGGLQGDGDCLYKQANAATCTRDEECTSGFCTDGVCCNARCDGQCSACDIVSDVGDLRGVCSQVRGEAPRNGREACVGQGSECVGICNTQTDACDYDEQARCGEESCSGEILSFGQCDFDVAGGTSTCSPAEESCAGGFACDEDASACRTSCETVGDCAAGRACAGGQCVLVEQVQCGDERTLVAPDGTETDCSPFKCSGSACLRTCESVNDCVAPLVCDTEGACVEAPPDPEPPTGCSASASEAPRDAAWLVIALGAALAGARTRRRAAGEI